MAFTATSKYLIVIAGPTAVGKTSFCIQLACQLNTEIVSADARQCYQGMAIGTAQPTPAEQQQVRHHLVNFLPITMPYSAGAYERDALQVLDKLFETHHTVIMTGGAGLYIKAVCEGLASVPPIAPKIQAQLNEQLKKEGLPTLLTALKAQDPDYYAYVDTANPQRIIRALAVYEATGRPYSSFRKEVAAHRPFNVIKIGLTRDRPTLYQRIDRRVDDMLAQGLMEEVVALYPYRHLNALQTVGYRELFAHLEGQYSQEEAVRLIKRNTRRYAKRQMTWFRHDTAMQWYSLDNEAALCATIDMLVAQRAVATQG